MLHRRTGHRKEKLRQISHINPHTGVVKKALTHFAHQHCLGWSRIHMLPPPFLYIVLIKRTLLLNYNPLEKNNTAHPLEWAVFHLKRQSLYLLFQTLASKSSSVIAPPPHQELSTQLQENGATWVAPIF